MLNWLKPPVFAQDDEKTHTAGLVNSILLSALAAVLLYVALAPVLSFGRLMTVVLPLLLLLLVLMVFLRRGHVRAVSLALVWGLWLILLYASYVNGGVRAPAFGGLIVVVMIAAFLVSARFGIFMAGLSVVSGIVLILLETNGLMPVSNTPRELFAVLMAQVTYFIVAAVLLALATRSIKQALTRAVSSEERYRLIASIMSDYVFSNRYGPNGEVVDQWLGGAFETITGYSPEVYYAQGGWLSILHPEDWEQDARDMALLYTNQQAVTEVRIIRRDGSVRWVRVYGHPVWDTENNRLAGMYGAVQDITAHKQMELDLRRRADEMALLYQISLALSSGEDLYHALRAFVKELKRVMTVDAFHIGLYDEETDLFSYSLFLNLDQDLQLPPRKLKEEPGLTWEVISNRRTLYLPDVMDPETRREHNVLIIVESDLHSYIGIPLVLQERVIGVMSVQSVQVGDYQPDQIRLLEALAAQVAITIEKANLLEQVKQELVERTRVEGELRQREAILETVTFAGEQFLKTSDWRLNINTVLERLGKTLDVTHAYLFEHFVDADGVEYSSLTYEWTAPGYPSDFDNPYYQTPHPLGSEQDSTDAWLRQGRIFVGNFSTFPAGDRERLKALGVQTMVEAPLFVAGRWWGTFGFDDFERAREWSNTELDALKVAVGILSAAIQRQETESAVRESERIYRQAIEAAGAVPYYRDYRENRYAFMGVEIEKIIGYKPEEVTMDLWLKIMKENIPLGEGTGLDIDEAVEQARTGRLKVWRSDMRVIARNGEERWITDSAVELFDENEFSYASVGILQDITDRKRTEANLMKRESILESITFAAEQFLKAVDWREQINAVLERLGREFNASHAYLFEKHPGPDGSLLNSLRYEWVAPGQRSDLDNPAYQNASVNDKEFKRYYEILDSGEPFIGGATYFREAKGEEAWLEETGIKALLEMRIVVNGRQWGTLGFDDMVNEREWTPMEVDVIRVAANVLGAAIQRQSAETALQNELDERKKLIEELKLRNAESETLRETTVIVTSTLDVSEAVKKILEQLKRVVPYDSASVWLYEGNSAYLIGEDNLPEMVERDKRYEVNDTEPDYPFWSENAPYILHEDIQSQYPRFCKPPIDYIHGWLSIPMRARGKLFGFISLDGRNVGQFSQQDAELALTYANQVSIALENARLFSGLQNELDERKKLIEELKLKNAESETLRESVAIVAATLEQAEAIDRVLEQLERVVHYNSASVQLLNEGMLEIVSARGLDLEQGHIGSRFLLDENEPAYPVMQGWVPYVLFEDVQPTVPAFRDAPHDMIHAWMAVPLKVKGGIIGIIALDGHQIGQFSARDAGLAVTYANQVAIALENARLFGELQAKLAERQKLISELENKNSELERFTYTVSHDLKSPLVTINGFLGYLEQDALSGNTERLKRDLQRISEAVGKMQKLLNELLELSRIGRVVNASESVPFEELVREASNLVIGRLEARRVTVEVRPDLPVVQVDRPRLVEVMQNLLDNAAKYMGGQARPHIEVGQRGEDAERGMSVFFVKDNGIGIAPEFHERIFGLFNKLDPRSDGTGVGLALVRRIIEVHGGRIWVESEAGHGSTFLFTLPTQPRSDSGL